MRAGMMCLVLFAALGGPLARASEPSSSTATAPGGGVLETASGGPESAPTANSRKMALKLHPLSMALGGVVGTYMLPLELEFAMTPNLSVFGLVTPFTGAASGLGLNGGIRLYFSGQAPDGFWVGGQLVTTLPTLLVAGPSDGRGLDFQPYLGYQWVFQNGVTLGIAGGVSVVALTSQANPRLPLVIQIPVGFAW